MLEKIKATSNFIEEKINARPETGIILGTGLGGLVDDIEIMKSLPYAEIPGFPVSTVDGHMGRLIFGKLAGREVLPCRAAFIFTRVIPCRKLLFRSG
jgi:purine-nucleoside phosphorylase